VAKRRRRFGWREAVVVVVLFATGRVSTHAQKSGNVSNPAVPSIARVRVEDPDLRSLAAQRTLERAILLAGPSVARLPIVLAATPPDGASDGVEAWVIPEPDGRVHQISVYRESAAFRCASGLIVQNYQCLLKVASAIVHEAWHYNHGADETGAYDAQIAFLVLNGGSSAQVAGVRRARERIVTGHHPVERGR
jgi:hypothetical protein